MTRAEMKARSDQYLSVAEDVDAKLYERLVSATLARHYYQLWRDSPPEMTYTMNVNSGVL